MSVKRTKLLRRLTTVFTGSLRTRGFVLWVAALVTGILCVSQHVYSGMLAGDIQDLRDARKSLETEIGFLSMERARLTSRERVEDYATGRLGMRYPEAGEVVRLGPRSGSAAAGWGDDLVEGSTVAVDNG